MTLTGQQEDLAPNQRAYAVKPLDRCDKVLELGG